jgi:hypothetical protein
MTGTSGRSAVRRVQNCLPEGAPKTPPQAINGTGLSKFLGWNRNLDECLKFIRGSPQIAQVSSLVEPTICGPSIDFAIYFHASGPV